MCTFEGVLVNDQEVVHLHLFSEGGLVRGGAAGEQLAGADAAGQGLRTERTLKTPLSGRTGTGNISEGIRQDQRTEAEAERAKLGRLAARVELKEHRASERTWRLRIGSPIL